MLLHKFTGALVSRTIDRSHSQVPEHAHDWPVLSLFVLGGYSNRTEVGDRYVSGPSAVLYRAGARHANTVSTDGFEQIEIEFDPAWLRFSGLPHIPVAHLAGGRIGAATRAMIDSCGRPMDEERFATALRGFLTIAVEQSPGTRPVWVDQVIRRLRQNPALRVTDLAREVNLHPSWLGAAYREAVGRRHLGDRHAPARRNRRAAAARDRPNLLRYRTRCWLLRPKPHAQKLPSRPWSPALSSAR